MNKVKFINLLHPQNILQVRELLDMWPHDKCIIFDGLDMDAVGDDTGRYLSCSINQGGYSYTFRRFELLKVVYDEMVARYGNPFPQDAMEAPQRWEPFEICIRYGC